MHLIVTLSDFKRLLPGLIHPFLFFSRLNGPREASLDLLTARGEVSGRTWQQWGQFSGKHKITHVFLSNWAPLCVAIQLILPDLLTLFQVHHAAALVRLAAVEKEEEPVRNLPSLSPGRLWMSNVEWLSWEMFSPPKCNVCYLKSLRLSKSSRQDGRPAPVPPS